MHDWTLQVSRHSHPRVGTTTRPGVGADPRVFQGTTTAQESRGLVCRTEESDRSAPLAPAPIEVCTGAVLPGSGCTEHQATGAVSHSVDNPCSGSHHLAEAIRELAASRLTAKDHSDHGVFQHPRLLTTVGHGVLQPITSTLVIPVSFSGTQHEAHNRQRQADASNPHDQAGKPSFQTAWFAFRRMSYKPWSLVCHIPNLRSVLMRGPRSGRFRETREREVQAASLFGFLFAPRTIGKSHSPRSFPASHALVVEP